jgi:hypothetical protein
MRRPPTARAARRAAALAAAAAAVAAAACNDFLGVPNPSAVQVGSLADSLNAPTLLNGAIGQFQTMLAAVAMYGGVLSDETRAAHVNISFAPVDQRTVVNLNDLLNGIYNPIQQARYSADTVGDRISGYANNAKERDLRVARMRALGGYTYMFLGENFCSAPINGGASQTPQQLFQAALPRFDEAIAVVRAAKAAGNTALSGDSILGLALVAAARTSLDLGDTAKARTYAAQVAAPFTEYRTYYTEGIPASTASPVNPYYNATGSPTTSTANTGNATGGFTYAAGSLWLTVDSAFIGLNDPRVPMTQRRVNAMNGTPQFVPNKPKSFGGYVAPSASAPGGAAMTPGASIRVASVLEAQYILAEVNGGNAQTLAFVNQQRAANGQGPSTATTAAAVLADLRDQRRREFYLDGHRLGDLRRYKRTYNVDQFPSGPYYTGGTYGSVECFPIPIAELNANPNATP